jgi:hypothetical protein
MRTLVILAIHIYCGTLNSSLTLADELGKYGRIRLCSVGGGVDQINRYLSKGLQPGTRNAILHNAKPLANSSSAGGGDCGVNIVDESCDLILVLGDETPRAIIGEAAPDGPTLQTRAAIDLLALLALPIDAVVLHHADAIDDEELIKLMTAEIRELISGQGLDGATLPVCECKPACSLKSQD